MLVRFNVQRRMLFLFWFLSRNIDEIYFSRAWRVRMAAPAGCMVTGPCEEEGTFLVLHAGSLPVHGMCLI